MATAQASKQFFHVPHKAAKSPPFSLPHRPRTPQFGRHCCRTQVRLLRSRQIVAALTESGELAVGSEAPNFQLLEPLTGNTVALSDLSGYKALLIMFICNHCPFVKHLKEAIVQLVIEYKPQGLATVAISSNSVQTHPQDGPDQMAEDAHRLGYPFPYLYDKSQETAKAYRAACTPEFFVFDGKRKLQYQGRFDSSRPSSDAPVTGEDVRAALEAILQHQQQNGTFRPSIGCNIKWHPNAEPDYFKS